MYKEIYKDFKGGVVYVDLARKYNVSYHIIRSVINRLSAEAKGGKSTIDYGHGKNEPYFEKEMDYVLPKCKMTKNELIKKYN